MSNLLDFKNIDLNCEKVWSLISDGNTKGVFQLESRLGQSMAKRLKPSNIEQLAALISIMRPGCLEAYREGKSVSNHYIDKKNGLESVDYFHSSLEPVLANTYGEMVYQEQAMEICQRVAGFDLIEADMLRKAIGKKNPEEMSRIKKLFLEKSKKCNIVSENESEEIFSWIEKSQRYSFNKSHAISYAINAYVSAYAKTHHPKKFFLSYLKFAKEKIDPMAEVAELVANLVQSDINISLPDFRKLNSEFILEDNTIYFGITNVKGVGDSVYNKIISLCKNYNLQIYDIGLLELLFYIFDQISSSSAKAMISVGALDYFKTPRKKILFFLEIISNLSQREKSIIIENNFFMSNTLLDIIENVKNFTNKRRMKVIDSLILSLQNPAYSLDDSLEWIANIEKQLLGTPITCSIVDSRNLEDANVDCKTLSKQRFFTKNIVIGAEIGNISIVKTKTGKNPGQEMSFIRLVDSTGSCDIVAFPNEYSKYKNLLLENNTVMFSLERSKNGDTLIIRKCWQL